jgi:pilus assembly protein TadC
MGRVVAMTFLGAAAAMVAAPIRPARRRLRSLNPAAADPTGRSLAGHPGLGATLGGLAVVLIVGGWPGLAGGVVAGVVLHRLLRRLEPVERRVERLRAAQDLPLAADLLAAALRAGVAVDRAAAAVGEALGGPLGERLARVARALRLGATADEAWRHLADVAGTDPLRTAAVRSAASGAAFASGLTRLAESIRATRLTDQDAAARRAAVLIVLPLGLCFLPAFVLAGLVPVVVAVLGEVL